ncbi:MAG: transporter associated domain-containing protein, partial [Gammaproteobacteria bacterium]|nr:transporter associated domain-containing protein [Gammaproteobacteria bacterium]
VTEKMSSLLRGKSDRPVTSIEEIRLLATLGRDEGAVGPRTAGIIVGATQLKNLRAEDVMLPRHQVVFLPGNESRDATLERVRQSGHSRFPFTPTDSIDQATGVVLAKELLLALETAGDGPIEWNTLIREPLVVPESQPLNMLLKTFQESRKHMAFVVDEYGQFKGIATLEDVLEEMVGEIFDESDASAISIARGSDGSIDTSAATELRKLAAVLGVDWDPREPAHSINGLLTERLGRLPRIGDTVDWQGHRIEVTAASERRAERVIVRPAAL